MAISGGVDSVVLLRFLIERDRMETYGYSLCAVHCEHGIRGEESLADMQFVRDLCKELGVELYLFSADCPALAKENKVSLETAAREFRQACFAEIVRTGKADYIATAHHQDDEAETVLFRLARGSSLRGAGGIRPVEGYFLRPLLSLSKREIYAAAEGYGATYRVDGTNLQTDATRNKLRLEVLPALENAVHGAAAGLARFAELARQDDELLYELSDELVGEREGKPFVRDCEKKPLFTRACLSALRGLGLQKDYAESHLTALFDLQRSERGSLCVLPKNFLAERVEDGLIFYKKKEEIVQEKPPEKGYDGEGFDGGRYALTIENAPPAEGECFGKLLWFDEKKLPKTAVFRFRKEGDFIDAFGSGKKSLKKLFNEKKIPPKEREYLPLLAEPTGEVYAVCGVEISKKVKVDDGKGKYLRLQRTGGKDGD